MGNVDFSSIGMAQVAISITPYLRGGAAIVKKGEPFAGQQVQKAAGNKNLRFN
ncbi:hypothetical protein GH811_04775 [Acetobacterium malicum]|uniref:Uncharacterized protein n=1 Tax=Acetobacterium malicum TaxID=52692 RepID=A0ABR6YUX9_9FIRM|nr:hypothetical protein [Acetobacterium malicum]MBC3898926.1 hypothetical protein [Acetobacterium malicum]